MIHIKYFTDGSIVYPHNNKRVSQGSFGYLSLSDKLLITDSFVAYSYPDIHYLEAMSIYYCLLRIQEIAKPNTKYTIFTDSDSAYSTIKSIILTSQPINPTLSMLNNTCIVISDLLGKMSQTIDIHVILIKSHSVPSTQVKYLRRQHLSFTERECKFICKGNFLVDQLVSNTARFIKAYSCLPNIKVSE